MKSVQTGINWNWYFADTKEEAEEYFKAITGSEPKYEDTIFKHDGKWAFRIHRFR